MRSQVSLRDVWLTHLLLAALTIAAYWSVGRNGFVSYDDDVYVTANLQVQRGISPQNIGWAFTSTEASNWHPLTWISHMLDCQFFGLNASSHHLTSLVMHIANVLILFYALVLMTGARWRSFFVAALFAVHPLNVESVAWIAERKNVLSTLFWLLTILAYIRYARKPGWNRYLTVTALFAAGLMSKPMLVTLPFTLLLLDYWPLRRLAPGGEDEKVDKPPRQRPGKSPKKGQENRGPVYQKLPIKTVLLEKVPLVVLSAASSIVTVVAQKAGGAVGSLERFPLSTRMANALVSYADYLREAFWPAGLAVLYPHPVGGGQAWKLTLAVFILAGMTCVVLFAATRRGYLRAGWFFYLGTLVPVIGLVQVGLQAKADRYTYVPMIGIFIMASFGAGSLVTRYSRALKPLAAAGVVILILLAGVTNVQLDYWHDSLALFARALSVTRDNYVAENNLGEALAQQGKADEASIHFARALEVNPNFPQSLQNMGMLSVQKGRLDEAIDYLSRAVEAEPHSFVSLTKLGAALAEGGRPEEGIESLSRALELNPNYAPANANLGVILERQGRIDEAIDRYSRAAQTSGGADFIAQMHYKIGSLMVKKQQPREAALHFREALRLKPDYALARQALGALGNGPSQ